MADDAPLERWSATAIADAVRNREIKALEVLDHHLERIDKLNDPLGAFVFLDRDRARQTAQDIDTAVADGRDPGPLAGVPLGIKVTETVEGWPNTHASTVFADQIGDYTTTHVDRLLHAGAVPVGLTAAPPMGLLSYTASALYGVCRNPWSPNHTPGGSSGGASAALAAGLVPLATGSDMGGSIRLPASFTGVVGVKPTIGRVPRGPGQSGGSNLVHNGPLARTVRDTARYLDCASGVSEHDAASSSSPVASFEASLDALPIRGLRVAVVTRLGAGFTDPAVRTVVEDAAAALIDAAGLERRDVTVSVPEEADLGTAAIAAIATADGQHADPAQVTRAAAIFLDLIATPGGAEVVAVLLGGRLPGGGRTLVRLAPAVRWLDERGLLPSAVRSSGKRLARGQRFRAAAYAGMAAAFEQADVLLMPTAPRPAFGATGPMPKTIDGTHVGIGAIAAFTSLLNVTGHPAVSVPAGVVDGLPVGLQIVTRRHEDHVALALARRFEQARPWPLLAPGY